MAASITRVADPTSVASTAGVTTYTSVSTGTAAADRIIVVAITKSVATSAVTAVTIDSGAGDQAMAAVNAGSTFGNVGAWLYWKHVPIGTTATIKITWSSAVATTNNHIGVYRIIGANNSILDQGTGSSTDMDATAPVGAIVSSASGAIGIAVLAGATPTTAAKTWAVWTEDIETTQAAVLTYTHTAATGSASGTVTCTGTTNLEDGAMAYGIFPQGTISLASSPRLISAAVPAPRDYPLSLRTWASDPLAPFPPYAPAATYMPSRVLNWGRALPIDFPIGLRTWTESAQQAPPNLPFAQDDWPVPVAPAYSVSLRTFIAINPPLLATSPPPPILMPPLIVEWGVSDRTAFTPASIQYNAPLLTQPVVTRPFVQADWPVPPTPQRAADLRTFISDTPIQLIGKDKLPVRQQNWPLPLLVIESARTWLQSPVTVGPLPFNQDSWPVPIAPDYSVSLRSFLASPSIPLISAPVQPPFSQDDWPLPIAAIQPIRTWTQAPTIATPVVAPNFMPGRVSEWGMWDRVPFSAAPFANLTLSLPVAVAVEYIFRAPSYSPQWTGPRFETWTASVNIALRAGPPPQKPFKQTDWPLTPAARQPDRTFQRFFAPELVGQDRLPVRQQSWPLTPATEFSNALRSIGFRSPALDVAAARPFVQSSWPLTPTASQPDRTFQRSFPRVLTGKDKLPVRQQDWPLPVAPRPAADLRTYIAQSPIRLIGKDRLPFRQQYWPVPQAPLEFHTLRSIMQGRVIYGGEAVPVPPEPEPPPPEVIHSVRAHADAYYGVFYADEIKGRADFSRAKGSNDEEAAN